MKTRITLMKTLLVILSAVVLVAAGGCKSKKETTVLNQKTGEEEIPVLCSEFKTDDEFFRANSVGESTDQALSKQKAMTNAKNEIAGSIETILKATIDNYFKDVELDNVSEVMERYEGMSREVVNQTLNGIRVVCEKLTRTPGNTYKTYVAIELAGDAIKSNMNKRLSGDDKLIIDFNYEKYREIFDKEMEDYEKKQRR